APLLAVLALGAMSASSRRHIALLVAVTTPLVGRGTAAAMARISRARPRIEAALPWSAALVVILTLGLFVRARLSDSYPLRPGLVAHNIPVESVERMHTEGLRGRVFTTIGLGSYVTWGGWPDLTTSIDSRLELFGGDFLAEHLEATRDRE